MRGHSASKQNNFVTDNIGNFQNIILDLELIMIQQMIFYTLLMV